MQSQKNGYTILVGEDELEVRAYLDMALKCLGYSVELAEDGEEVLSHLRSSRSVVSAVLLDLMMPQRDGMDVLREIRHVAPNLPVIIVSGAGSTLNVVTAMKSGATDFLCKPVTHDELRRSLSKALENKIAFEVAPSSSVPAPSARTKAFFGASPRMPQF
jgi:DNA-binding NtrC family response regulator